MSEKPEQNQESDEIIDLVDIVREEFDPDEQASTDVPDAAGDDDTAAEHRVQADPVSDDEDDADAESAAVLPEDECSCEDPVDDADAGMTRVSSAISVDEPVPDALKEEFESAMAGACYGAEPQGDVAEPGASVEPTEPAEPTVAAVVADDEVPPAEVEDHLSRDDEFESRIADLERLIAALAERMDASTSESDDTASAPTVRSLDERLASLEENMTVMLVDLEKFEKISALESGAAALSSQFQVLGEKTDTLGEKTASVEERALGLEPLTTRLASVEERMGTVQLELGKLSQLDGVDASLAALDEKIVILDEKADTLSVAVAALTEAAEAAEAERTEEPEVPDNTALALEYVEIRLNGVEERLAALMADVEELRGATVQQQADIDALFERMRPAMEQAAALSAAKALREELAKLVSGA